MKLDRNHAVLVIIDVQERLMPAIHDAERVAQNVERMIRGSHILGIPTIVTEQYVKGLGPTIASVKNALAETSGYRPIEKACFSAQGCDSFAAQLAALERRQVLMAGVEAHVCVYQTVTDLLARNLEVTLLADAMSSRTPENKDIALRRMTADGAKLASTEMALFELLVTSGTDEFRAISKLVK